MSIHPHENNRTNNYFYLCPSPSFHHTLFIMVCDLQKMYGIVVWYWGGIGGYWVLVLGIGVSPWVLGSALDIGQ